MKTISGHTKPYAVLGHPIGHSLSPVMHNASISQLGLDAIYLAFDVAPDNLMDVLNAMGKMGFGGVNLTVPLKEVAFRGVDELAPSASMTGSVNTVEFLADGRLKGHSTDGDGFTSAFSEHFNTALSGKSVLLLGCGGAGRAVAFACAAQGVSEIHLADISEDQAQGLAGDLSSHFPALAISFTGNESSSWAKAAADAHIIIQATPIGMKPGDQSILPASAFNPEHLVFDLIYMFPETAIMKAAATAGAKSANGLSMLLHQGARAFEIWSGTQPAVEAMREALEQAVYNS